MQNKNLLNHKLNSIEQQRWQDTLQALEDVSAGRIVDGELVHAWLASWGKADEPHKPSQVTKE